jgi:hypothetical protein
MHKFAANINRNGKGFSSLEIRSKIIGHINVVLDGNELIFLDTTVHNGICLSLET